MTQERTPVSPKAAPVCWKCGEPFVSGDGAYWRHGFPGEYHKRCLPVAREAKRLTLHLPLETSPDLLALIEWAKNHKMTPEEIDAQRRSWVRGQMGLTDPSRTPEQIDAALDAVLGPPLSAQLAAAKREGMEEAIRILDALPRGVERIRTGTTLDMNTSAQAYLTTVVRVPTVDEGIAAIRAKMEGK